MSVFLPFVFLFLFLQLFMRLQTLARRLRMISSKSFRLLFLFYHWPGNWTAVFSSAVNSNDPLPSKESSACPDLCTLFLFLHIFSFSCTVPIINSLLYQRLKSIIKISNLNLRVHALLSQRVGYSKREKKHSRIKGIMNSSDPDLILWWSGWLCGVETTTCSAKTHQRPRSLLRTLGWRQKTPSHS